MCKWDLKTWGVWLRRKKQTHKQQKTRGSLGGETCDCFWFVRRKCGSTSGRTEDSGLSLRVRTSRQDGSAAWMCRQSVDIKVQRGASSQEGNPPDTICRGPQTEGWERYSPGRPHSSVCRVWWGPPRSQGAHSPDPAVCVQNKHDPHPASQPAIHPTNNQPSNKQPAIQPTNCPANQQPATNKQPAIPQPAIQLTNNQPSIQPANKQPAIHPSNNQPSSQPTTASHPSIHPANQQPAIKVYSK